MVSHTQKHTNAKIMERKNILKIGVNKMDVTWILTFFIGFFVGIFYKGLEE